MYLTDYHSHSICSMDSTTPLQQMVEAATNMSIQELCTTDHYDLLTEDGELADKLDWSKILTQYEKVQRTCPDGFTLRLGLEFGSGQVNPALAQEILSEAPLDYVIGSIHNVSATFGRKDIYMMDFSDINFCHQILDDYISCMTALAPLPCYDCMGHVTLPLRYMPPMGDVFMTSQYRDRMKTLFEIIVRSGHGIELNTTRNRNVEALRPIMALYRDCGGEIITLGADGHTPKQVGVGIIEGQELLRQVGFRYHTIYEKRIPQFVKL